MPETLEPSQTLPKAIPSTLLQGKLDGLRHKHLMVLVLTGVSLILTLGVEMLALEMFLDWWLDLPRVVRLLLLLAQALVLGIVLFRFVIHPVFFRPDDDEFALMVERARPEFRTRLIAAIQLTRPGTLGAGVSASLVDATVGEAERLAGPVDFAGIVSTARMRKLAGLAGLVLFMGLLGMGYGRAVTFDLLKRAFLSDVPVPRKTRVVIPDGNHLIGRGDSVVLQAYAEGVVPATGTIILGHRGRRDQEYVMNPDEQNRARFTRTIENVQESFTYQVHLNDGSSSTFTVRAIPRPTVASIECNQEFPAYTGLAPVRRPLGDLTLLAGSRLQLRVKATKPIQSAMLRTVGTNSSPIELKVAAEDPQLLTGELPIPAGGLTGFSVEMTDLEGMESSDSAVYRIEIVPDKPPVVRITAPERKEELLTRDAEFPVGIQVEDDFEVARLRILYTIDTRDGGREQSLELDMAGATPERLMRLFIWELAKFEPPLREESVIEFWIEATDNNDATGPGIGVSDHQLARIVTRDEKRAELLNRAGDAFASIDDAATDQEALHERLGAIIREKEPAP